MFDVSGTYQERLKASQPGNNPTFGNPGLGCAGLQEESAVR